MANVHEKDQDSINEVARAFGDIAGNNIRPSDREKVAVLVELVYAKGRLRGYQDAVETGKALLERAASERPGGRGVIDLDSLALNGATQVVIDFGPNALIKMRISEVDRDGWDVWDTSRRYSHSIAEGLSFEDAVRRAQEHVRSTGLASEGREK